MRIRLIIGLLAILLSTGAAAQSRLDPGPEPLVLRALAAIRAADADRALEAVEALRRQYPDYRLGQLLALQLNAWLAGDTTLLRQLKARHGELIAALTQEARLRWQHHQQEEKIHRRLHQWILRPGRQPWWVVVDMTGSRLYLLHNRNGRLQVVEDIFVSIGQKGYGKQRRGDRRTPVGIYRIVDWLPDEKLPPLYGAGALPLNYPNAWDRMLGRTGSGIWLHGTPPGLYVRPPRSSKGCVVLNNDAVEALHAVYRLPLGTPVLLVDDLKRVGPLASARLDALARQLPEGAPLVRYPGEVGLWWSGWRTARGWQEHWWRFDGHSWQLALRHTEPVQLARR